MVEGAWWPADYVARRWSPSMPTSARGWGVGVGDTLTVNVLGRDIPLRIANSAATSNGAGWA